MKKQRRRNKPMEEREGGARRPIRP